MDKLGCVMDVELFEKFSSDDFSTDNRSPKYNDIWGFLQNEQKRFGLKDIADFTCLVHFLNDVIKGKYKVYCNNDIIEEYSKLLKKLPPELKYSFNRLSDGLFEKKEGKLDIKEQEKFKGIIHEKKMKYIIVASSLEVKRKLLISTHDDIKNNYEPCCDKLLLIQVGHREICKAIEETSESNDK